MRKNKISCLKLEVKIKTIEATRSTSQAGLKLSNFKTRTIQLCLRFEKYVSLLLYTILLYNIYIHENYAKQE